MKKLLHLFLGAILLLPLGCEPSSESGGSTSTSNYIEISQSTLNLEIQNSSTTQLLVFTTTVPWTISLSDSRAMPSWIRTDKNSGSAGENRVIISAEANSSSEIRVAYLTINANGLDEKVIKITQLANEDSGSTGGDGGSTGGDGGSTGGDGGSTGGDGGSTGGDGGNTGGDGGSTGGDGGSTGGDGGSTGGDGGSTGGDGGSTGGDGGSTGGDGGSTGGDGGSTGGDGGDSTLTAYYIRLGDYSENLPALNGSFTINVEANSSWIASNIPSWLTFSDIVGKKDNRIDVTYTSNDTKEERTARIKFDIGVDSVFLDIRQNFELENLEDLDIKPL